MTTKPTAPASKLYTYTEEQINKLYAYLMNRPMVETENLVVVLRSPLKVEDAPAAASASTTEASSETAPSQSN